MGSLCFIIYKKKTKLNQNFFFFVICCCCLSDLKKYLSSDGDEIANHLKKTDTTGTLKICCN